MGFVNRIQHLEPQIFKGATARASCTGIVFSWTLASRSCSSTSSSGVFVAKPLRYWRWQARGELLIFQPLVVMLLLLCIHMLITHEQIRT